MDLTDEELMFYDGDDSAWERLGERCNRTLSRVADLILQQRTGSGEQARVEWDLELRLARVWNHVLTTRQGNMGRWPNQRLSVLTWLIHLICLEMDRHLEFHGPF